MPRRVSARIAVVFGYVCVALAFTWPLPLQLGTALTGDPAGDAGVYIWNQWVFRHELLVDHHNPLTTDQVLSLSDPVDLSQHNYTAFLNLLALPLIPWLGVVRTFNIVLLIASVLTALTTYALARRVTMASRFEAWIVGVAFAWSPILVARTTGHFSLVAAAPLAAFLLCLINADRSRSTRDAALAGLCIAWAGFCDAYYAVFCLIIAIGYLASRLTRVTFAQKPASTHWYWTLDLLILIVAGLVAGLLFGRGGRFELLGAPISVRGLYTPVLVLTVLVFMRVVLAVRPRISAVSSWSPAALRAVVVGLVACVGPLSPVIYGLGERLVEGQFVSPPTLWRSSPRGVDLLAFGQFNPNHPLYRRLHDGQAISTHELAEFTATLGIVALIVIALAAWRAGYRPRVGWVLLTVSFAALSLGPFVHVAGFNTFVPGPWAVLRYVPIIGAARTPARFAVVAALGAAILLAGALAALGRRYPQRRGLITATIAVALFIELWPAPRPLYSAAIPSIYQIIAADPRPVRVLQLPFGVRDGASSVGNYSASYQYYQTLHGKKLIGGYLSRISRRRVGEVRSQPTLDALLTMSEGRFISDEQAAMLRARGPGFIDRAKVGYVVIHHTYAAPHLIAFVVDAWGLKEVAREGPKVLYVPTVGSEASR